MTKGEMVQILKRFGIRRAEKQGVGEVSLEHIKYEDICNIFAEFEKTYQPGKTKSYGTGDGLHFRDYVIAQAIEAPFAD